MDIDRTLLSLGILLPLIVVAAIWEAVWKGIALWKAARNSDLVWFIAILILNTIGILPIIYILAFSKKKSTPQPIP